MMGDLGMSEVWMMLAIVLLIGGASRAGRPADPRAPQRSEPVESAGARAYLDRLFGPAPPREAPAERPGGRTSRASSSAQTLR
jgi:hypothetical protein